MNALQKLVTVVIPPALPREVPTEPEWMAVELKLGKLPQDYHEFLASYGTGQIDEFISIFNPASKNKYINLLYQVGIQLDVLRDLEAGGSEIIPYKLFPEEGGLLPFASTSNGDIIYWMAQGNPEEWTVIVNDSRSPNWQEFSYGMSEFLEKILTRSESCKIFPSDFPSARPRFSQA